MTKILFTTFMLMSLISAFSQGGTKNFIDQNYMEVTGAAEKEIIPDRIYLHIRIDEKNNNGARSIEKQEEMMLKKLKAEGVDVEKDLSVISFSSTYIRFFLKKNDVKKAKEYELILRSSEKLAPVFAALDKLEIASASIAKLDHSQMMLFKKETQILAVKAAKNKALNYAEALNEKIGKTLYIQELNTGIDANFSQANVLNEVVLAKTKYTGSSGKYQNIQLQKIRLSANVLARFAIQ